MTPESEYNSYMDVDDDASEENYDDLVLASQTVQRAPLRRY